MINPYLIIAAIGALLVSFISGGVLGWHEKAIRVPALLEAQQTTDQKECTKAQQLTKEANNVLQKNRDSIARKLAALRLQHPSTCVRVSSPSELPVSGDGHAGQNGSGLSTDWLREYAADAESNRKSIIECMDFVARERAPNKK